MNDNIWTRINYKTAIALAAVTVLLVALVAGFISYLFATQNSEQTAAQMEKETERQDRKLIEAQIAMCERIKADMIDNARAWTRAEETWIAQALIQGMPLKQQRSALKTAITYGESANQLRSRLYHCPPLITKDKGIIDQRALDEAQGDL